MVCVCVGGLVRKLDFKERTHVMSACVAPRAMFFEICWYDYAVDSPALVNPKSSTLFFLEAEASSLEEQLSSVPSLAAFSCCGPARIPLESVHLLVFRVFWEALDGFCELCPLR